MITTHTPGPWDYVPGNNHHGPYVTSNFGSTICDCYVMSEPSPVWGGTPKPVSFLHEMAEPNARLIAAAPEMLVALLRAEALLIMLGGETQTLADIRAAIAKAAGR